MVDLFLNITFIFSFLQSSSENHARIEHFIKTFLWSIRVQTMENCGQFVKYI